MDHYLQMKDAVLFKAVREACHRNLYLWANTWLAASVSYGTKVKKSITWYQTTAISIMVVFGALTVASLVWQIVIDTKNKKKEAK